MEERSEKNLPITEQIVKSLIRGHAVLGEIKEGQNLLELLNQKNIHWGRHMYTSFVLGSARYGDVEATNLFLQKFKEPSDSLLLDAVQEMHKKHPDRIGFLLDKMPQDVQNFSSLCRRTVKMLVESGDVESAWKLVKKSRDIKENNSDKERVIKISPSVIVLKELMSKSEDVDEIIDKIDGLMIADIKIVSRAVTVLVDICFEDKSKLKFARKVVDEIFLRINDFEGEEIKNYIGQSAKRRLFRCKTDAEIYEVFEVFCNLGLKLERIRSWDIMMKQLVPNLPEEGTWTHATLFKKVHEVKDNLSSYSNQNGGIYSHSVIWGIILQHLFNRENAIFFAMAAKLCVNLKVAYAPKRWHVSLTNCLLKLKDVQSYVDVLDVSYKNCVNKGDFSDFSLLAKSLPAAIYKGGRLQVDMDSLLGEILDEIWRRGIQLPPYVRDDMVKSLLKNNNRNLANALENIPVLGANTFKKSVRHNNVRERLI